MFFRPNNALLLAGIKLRAWSSPQPHVCPVIHHTPTNFYNVI